MLKAACGPTMLLRRVSQRRSRLRREPFAEHHWMPKKLCIALVPTIRWCVVARVLVLGVGVQGADHVHMMSDTSRG